MQRNFKVIAFVFFLFIVVFFASGTRANAQVVYEQLNYGSEVAPADTPNYVSGGIIKFRLGTGITASGVPSFSVKAHDNASLASPCTSAIWHMYVYEYASSAYTGGSVVATPDTLLCNTVGTVVSASFSTTSAVLTFDPTKYYEVQFFDWCVFPSTCRILGTSGNVPYALFEILDPETLTNSRIITQNLPQANSTASTTLVTFDFDFYNNDVDDEYGYVGVEIRDMTQQYQYASLELPIYVSGEGNFARSRVLTANHFHMWRPYMRGTSTTIYGSWYGFEVVGASASSSQINFINQEASSTSFFDFLNVPALLREKKPTGYFFQIATILENVSDYPASTTGSASLDFSVIASGTPLASIGQVVIFGTSTVLYFINPTILNLFNTLILAILYVGVAFHLFNKILHFRA